MVDKFYSLNKIERNLVNVEEMRFYEKNVKDRRFEKILRKR